MILRVSAGRLRLLTAVLAAGFLNSGFTDAMVTASSSEVIAEAVISTAVDVTRRNDESLTAFDVDAWDASEVSAINQEVLKLALAASRCATHSGDVEDPRTLTIIDYSKASTEPRMWVLDMRTRELLYEELVAHGQGSGGNFATKFSNQPDSHQTSLGLFVTEGTYVGRNGYSLRLNGLDRGFNDRARERAIVMHGAPYVNSGISKSLGRLGRSHGCPAVRDAVARELIDRVKGGSLVFSYYPDQEWLNSSKYLTSCGATVAE
jgi:hypothetical protein